MHPDTLGGIVIIVLGLIVWIGVCEYRRRERKREAIAAAKRRHPSSLARRPDAADRALALWTQRAREQGHEPRWTHPEA